MQLEEMVIVRSPAPAVIDRLIAATVLVLASAAVRLLPFRTLAKSAEWGRANAEPAVPDWNAARRTARAVESASRHIPWRTVCIQEAFALHWILRWRSLPSFLHFGISPGEDRLSAHVWVSLAGKILIGEESAGSHVQVATFPSGERIEVRG